MKIASFKAGQTATYGLVTNAGIIDAGKRLKAFPTLKALLADGSLDALKALQTERPDVAFGPLHRGLQPPTAVDGAPDHHGIETVRRRVRARIGTLG